MSKWAPNLRPILPIKLFWGWICCFLTKFCWNFKYHQNLIIFGQNLLIKSHFYLVKIFWNFFLSNRMFQKVIWTMPFPEKNNGARNPFIIIGCLKLSILCATIKIDQFYKISAKIWYMQISYFFNQRNWHICIILGLC